MLGGLAIVAILAGVAYPSYLESVKRARRSEARSYLLEAQQFMARFYSANSRYTTDEAGTTSPALPARLQSVPADAPRYTLSVTATANGYTLTAPPLGDDDCGHLTPTHTRPQGRTGQGAAGAEVLRRAGGRPRAARVMVPGGERVASDDGRSQSSGRNGATAVPWIRPRR